MALRSLSKAEKEHAASQPIDSLADLNDGSFDESLDQVFIPVEEVSQFIKRIGLAAHEHFLTIPDRVQYELMRMKDAASIQHYLKEVIRESLITFSEEKLEEMVEAFLQLAIFSGTSTNQKP